MRAMRQAYRVDPTGNALASDEPIDDFSVRTLGFQIRYRYEFAPLSYLYVVYGRGGYDQDVVADESASVCFATASACAMTINCW